MTTKIKTKHTTLTIQLTPNDHLRISREGDHYLLRYRNERHDVWAVETKEIGEKIQIRTNQGIKTVSFHHTRAQVEDLVI